MGNKLYLLFEYLYIIMALFSIYVAITEWETDRNRAYLFIFFASIISNICVKRTSNFLLLLHLACFFSRENLEKKLRTVISKNSFK